ncbi:MAG: winged helix-turn-helix transcriptional regulator [Bacteroidota bacterium]
MAALLLFARDEIIQSAIPHYKIDALLRKENIDRYDDRENIRCNLIEAYDKLMAFVSKHLPDKFYLDGIQRISLREKIFREVVANMLIHREYNNAFPSSLVIYNDWVETKNANKPTFIGQLVPGKFEPYPKNPNIAQIFTQMGRSEELGTGVKNVYKYSKAYSGSDNIVFKEDDIFISRVPLTATFNNINKVTEKVTEKVTDNQSLIINFIKDNPQITTNELARLVGISQRKIKENISKIKDRGLIKRKGAAKGGCWEVIVDN